MMKRRIPLFWYAVIALAIFYRSTEEAKALLAEEPVPLDDSITVGLSPGTADPRDFTRIQDYTFLGIWEGGRPLPANRTQRGRSGGDPERGRQLFFDTQGKAGCARCHTVRGQGGKVGPDLSYIDREKGLPYIIESVINPSAVILGDFVPHLVVTKGGEHLVGIKKEESEESILLMTVDEKLRTIQKSDIKEIAPQNISIMPGNFREILTVEELNDLFSFLRTLN